MKQLVKKAAVVMACVFGLGISYSYAATKDNGEIKNAFRHDFENAQLMSTESHDHFTKVFFTLNGQVMTAFYSTGGNLLAVTRNLVTSQLPMNLLMGFKNRYSEYWVTDLFEMSQDATSSYYLTIENADKKITLRSNGEGWDVYASEKK
jgi:hypothetical protein